MPRIRKKTSKRGSTNQREKIKHKAAETRKKRKRDAKKNTQWKSKNPKDLGIPNNFPYKDEILAEVAEERRQIEEAKQRRKELKKAAKAGGDPVVDEASEDEGEGAYDGIRAVSGKQASTSKAKVVDVEEDAANADESPLFTNPDMPNLGAVLEAADVVVEVLDARDPLAYRSSHLEEVVKAKVGQKLLLVLNKIDACPRESVASWATSLRAEHPTLLFRSASAFLPSSEPVPVPFKGKGKARADDAVGIDSILSALEKWASEKKGEQPLVVAVVGVTNAGKSSLVNSLVKKAAVPVYTLSTAQDGHSTTSHAQEVALEIGGKQVRIIDTPGMSWVPPTGLSEEEGLSLRARDVITRNKGHIDRLKDPEPVVNQLVTRAGQEDLMLFYNLPAFADKDTTAFLSALARVNNYIKKGGVLDLAGAARLVLRDWSIGKFPRYTVPGTNAAGDSVAADSWLAELYAKDEKVLSLLTPRKELRKTKGIVKLSAAAIESRKIALDASWIGKEAESDDEDEDEEDEEAEESEDAKSGDEDSEEDELEGSDEDAEADEDDEDEDEEPVLPTSKRKRSAATAPDSPPKKKVAFGPDPKNSKQARSAAGARGAATRQAKQVAPKETPSKAAKPTKSKPVVAKKPLKSAISVKKVANAAPSKKSVSQAKAGEEVYDFKKFF